MDIYLPHKNVLFSPTFLDKKSFWMMWGVLLYNVDMHISHLLGFNSIDQHNLLVEKGQNDQIC